MITIPTVSKAVIFLSAKRLIRLGILLSAVAGTPGCEVFTNPSDDSDGWSVTGFGGTVGKPYVDEEIVVSGVAFSNRVFAVDRGSGRVIWETELHLPLDIFGDRDLSSQLQFHAFDDLLVLAAGWLYGLDPKTGEVVWSLTPSHEQPARGGTVVAGNRLIAAGSERLYMINPETGAILSTIEVGEYPFSPIYDGGVVYFGARAGGEPSASGVPLGEGHAMAVDLESGDILWKHLISDHPTAPWKGGVVNRGALTRELFIVAGLNARVYALERTTGEARWVYEGRSPFRAQVQVVGEVAVVAETGSGTITGLAISTGHPDWFETSFRSGIVAIGKADGMALPASGRIMALSGDGEGVWGYGGAGWGEPIFVHTPVVRDGILYANSVETGLYAVPLRSLTGPAFWPLPHRD